MMCHCRLTKEYEKCEIIILPKRYNMQLFTLGFQKDSPYLGLFNYYLRKMRQEGSLDKNVKGYEAAQQACPDKTGKALGFKNLIFPIFILVLGCKDGFRHSDIPRKIRAPRTKDFLVQTIVWLGISLKTQSIKYN